jgi:hypothetical protein
MGVASSFSCDGLPSAHWWPGMAYRPNFTEGVPVAVCLVPTATIPPIGGAATFQPLFAAKHLSWWPGGNAISEDYPLEGMAKRTCGDMARFLP